MVKKISVKRLAIAAAASVYLAQSVGQGVPANAARKIASHEQAAGVQKSAVQPVPAPQHLVELVRDAKIVDAGYRLSAHIEGAEATIETDCSARDKDKDLKIDAVLISKVIMQPDRGTISRVTVAFKSPDSEQARQVAVTKGDILAFGNGQLSEEDLLSSLSITNPQAGNAQDTLPEGKGRKRLVADGPLSLVRLSLYTQINLLRRKGTDVRTLEEMFQKAEDYAAQGDADKLRPQITMIQDKLAEQEQLVQQASQVAQGHGVTPLGGGQGSPQKAQGGRLSQPWFPKGMIQVQNYLHNMERQGQDVSSYRSQFEHIKELHEEHRQGEASEALRSLQQQLGITNGAR